MPCPPPADHGQNLTQVGQILGSRSSGPSIGIPSGPPVAKWLEDPKRARWQPHFTPTSSSWLNLIECYFNELTERRLRRGVFTSLPQLIEAIEIWAEHWNADPKFFVWHK